MQIYRDVYINEKHCSDHWSTTQCQNSKASTGCDHSSLDNAKESPLAILLPHFFCPCLQGWSTSVAIVHRGNAWPVLEDYSKWRQVSFIFQKKLAFHNFMIISNNLKTWKVGNPTMLVDDALFRYPEQLVYGKPAQLSTPLEQISAPVIFEVFLHFPHPRYCKYIH